MNEEENYIKKYTISNNKFNKIEYLYKENLKQKIFNDMREKSHDSVVSLLLDSSLIFATHYDYKIIECGKYIQVYKLNEIRKKKPSKENKSLEISIKFDVDRLYKKENYNKKNDLKQIEYKNILRSKLQLQRIVKSNEDEFKTFLTLTFGENKYTDIEKANKKFAIWRTKIQSIFKDFKYVCVPEYQKGREKKYGYAVVHYHLLTNLEIEKIYEYTRRNKTIKTPLIIPQKQFSDKQLETMSLEQRKRCYDVKYWSYGYSSVYPLKNINVVGYLTKYMTKDIDNRLFGKRKYLNSRNLNMPKEFTVDSRTNQGYGRLLMINNLYDVQFSNSYLDYFGNIVDFTEYKL